MHISSGSLHGSSMLRLERNPALFHFASSGALQVPKTGSVSKWSEQKDKNGLSDCSARYSLKHPSTSLAREVRRGKVEALWHLVGCMDQLDRKIKRL